MHEHSFHPNAIPVIPNTAEIRGIFQTLYRFERNTSSHDKSSQFERMIVQNKSRRRVLGILQTSLMRKFKPMSNVCVSCGTYSTLKAEGCANTRATGGALYV